MIEKLTVHYNSQQISVSLFPFTVIAGPAIEKKKLLGSALSFLSTTALRSLSEAMSEPFILPVDCLKVEITRSLPSGTYLYEFSWSDGKIAENLLLLNDHREIIVRNEHTAYIHNQYRNRKAVYSVDTQELVFSPSSSLLSLFGGTEIARAFFGYRVYRVSIEYAKKSNPLVAASSLEPDASNLAAFYFRLSQDRPEVFRDIESRIASLVPEIGGISVRRSEDGRLSMYVVVDGKSLPVAYVSETVVQLLCYFASLYPAPESGINHVIYYFPEAKVDSHLWRHIFFVAATRAKHIPVLLITSLGSPEIQSLGIRENLVVLS